MVRAYAYSLREGKKGTYQDFVANFITPNGTDTQQELVDFLNAEFGIEYLSHQEIGVTPNYEDLERLYEELKVIKKSDEKARTDASLILTIYALRDKHGEKKSSLEGYKTWWLSSDTTTHRTISRLFKEKYPISCYMRPDFLYNYISFTPPKQKVSQLYKNTFPNLLGVQISNHIPEDISRNIRKSIQDHSDQMNSRVKAKIRNLVDRLKTNPDIKYTEELQSYFETPQQTQK